MQVRKDQTEGKIKKCSIDEDQEELPVVDNQNQSQAYFGEDNLPYILTEKGHEIIISHTKIEEMNTGGIDLVTLKGDTVFFIDNKAGIKEQPSTTVVKRVDPLTINFEEYKMKIMEELKALIAKTNNSKQLEKALHAIEQGKFKKVVTNANWKSAVRKTGITKSLQEKDIIFVDILDPKTIP